MGLIKAGIGALGGTLADQWKEFFYCDAAVPPTLRQATILSQTAPALPWQTVSV